MTVRKRNKKRFLLKNISGVLTTLTAAVALVQNVERVAVTTVQDMTGMFSQPVTYAQIEALRVSRVGSWVQLARTMNATVVGANRDVCCCC
jgi:hypothetical protein